MKVGTGGNLDLSREYHDKLFGPLFYSWWNCPLILLVVLGENRHLHISILKGLTGTLKVCKTFTIEISQNVSSQDGRVV